MAPVIGLNGNPVAAVCGTLADTSGTSLMINASSSLDIVQNGALTSVWGDANNAPLLVVTGKLQIESGTPIDFNNPTGIPVSWNNGTIVGSGTIYLNNGALLQALNKAQNLGANLEIGMDGLNGQQQKDVSNFTISDASAKNDAMGQNLTLSNDANIDIEGLGRLVFQGDTNQNSQGGIVEATGSTDAINDAGVVEGTADTGGQVLTVQPYVYINNGGTWQEVANERMKFTYSGAVTSIFVGSKSTLELDNNSNIMVTGGASAVVVDAQGTILVPSTAGVQQSAATIQGRIVDYGNIQIGDANGFATLDVMGDVDIETGALTMWAEFDATGLIAQDQLSVSGQFAVDADTNPNSTLTVTTLGVPPKKGIPVQLVTAGSTTTQSTKAFVFDKTTFNGYAYPAGQLTAKSYVLTT